MKADQKDLEMNELENGAAYDPLDMSNYHLNRFRKENVQKLKNS